MTVIIEVALGVALGLLLYRWLQHLGRRFRRPKSDDVVVINKAELSQLLGDFKAMAAVLGQLVSRRITDSSSFPQDLATEATRIMADIYRTVELTRALER
jgi:NhaP-type Na+/H+ or K+/H+ antiporter